MAHGRLTGDIQHSGLAVAAVMQAVPEMEEETILPVETLLYAKTDLKTVFLGGIFGLGVIAALYIGSDIAMPMVLAFVLKLVLQPLLRGLTKIGLPQTLASLLIMVALTSAIAGIASALSGPASAWAAEFPDTYSKLQQRLSVISHPLVEAQKIMAHADDLSVAPGPKVMPVAVQGTRFSDKAIAEVQQFAGTLVTTLLILFFLLVSGDTFLRRLVEVLPRFKDKRQAVDIFQAIEQDISSYLLTITAMNAAVGVATGMVATLTGLGDPLLWGTLAFLLNYIPLAGPLVNACILLIAGLMTKSDGEALLPAASYFMIHMAEGAFITPMLIAKRFTLNPLLVIMSLVFWYKMWGVPGAILSMPMLAITRIICDRIQPLKAFGHLLAG